MKRYTAINAGKLKNDMQSMFHIAGAPCAGTERGTTFECGGVNNHRFEKGS